MLKRRHLQLGLGVLWLIDAALQFQPYMFSAAFPRQNIAGAADGQPSFIVAGVHWAAHLMTAAPVATNAAFATGQLLLALGLFYRRTSRLALVGSVLWALSVWYFGEALGGIASGTATIIIGAPGAAVLYALVATLAWPIETNAQAPDPARATRAAAWNTSRWTAIAPWALVWCSGALLQFLPAQRHSWRFPIALGVGLVIIGVLPVFGRRAALIGATAGAVLGLTCWIFGQSFGEFWTGQATDPNSGPLLVLLALALVARTSTRSASKAVALIQTSVGQLPTAGSIGTHTGPTRSAKRTK